MPIDVLCDMETDPTENGESEMVTLDVTVPETLLAEIDKLAEDLGYSNRSEFVRRVLRGTTEPVLTPGAWKGVSRGYADIAAGRTTSHDAVKQTFDGS